MFFWVRIEDFEAICFNFACELLTFDQPIPPFTTRFPGVLESCLSLPLQGTTQGDLYPTFEDKLAQLFYFMVKKHPFLNGNKRIAIATLLLTLYGNKKWISVPSPFLYKLAIDVAKSSTSDYVYVIKKIKKIFIKNIINIRI